MNFIAYDAAYSLYPRATFEDKVNLVFKHDTPNDRRCIGKYTVRGWTPVINTSENEKPFNNLFYVGQPRFVDDPRCWRLPLDTSGIQRRRRLSQTSEPFHWDPAVQNSWVLQISPVTDYITPAFLVATSSVFRFKYLCGTRTAYDVLTMFGHTQSKIQWMIGKRFDAPTNDYSWSW